MSFVTISVYDKLSIHFRANKAALMSPNPPDIAYTQIDQETFRNHCKIDKFFVFGGWLNSEKNYNFSYP